MEGLRNVPRKVVVLSSDTCKAVFIPDVVTMEATLCVQKTVVILLSYTYKAVLKPDVVAMEATPYVLPTDVTIPSHICQAERKTSAGVMEATQYAQTTDVELMSHTLQVVSGEDAPNTEDFPDVSDASCFQSVNRDSSVPTVDPSPSQHSGPKRRKRRLPTF
jgi:hypothetical protein